MKTEQEITESIEKVRRNIEPIFKKALYQFQDGDYNDCSETLHTLIVNVVALEAAQTIID